jgi:hypothetical protein
VNAQEMAQQVTAIIENHWTVGAGMTHCTGAAVHGADMLLQGLHMSVNKLEWKWSHYNRMYYADISIICFIM